MTLNGHWQRKPLSQPNCRTTRISCLYGKVDMVCSLKFLISYRTWIRTSVGAYNTLRDTLVLSSSPMGREVAATFLPHPAPGMQQFISEESSPIARSATSQAIDPVPAGGNNEAHLPEHEAEHDRSTRSDYSCQGSAFRWDTVGRRAGCCFRTVD